MAFYYVKNDGTATGDAGRYATKQTGTFAGLGVSGYYATITLAIAATTSPAAGDFILVSDVHSHTAGASITYTGITPVPFTVFCVSDIAIDASRRSGNRGFESTAGTSNFTITNMFINGLELHPTNDAFFTGVRHCLRDCKIIGDGAADVPVSIAGDGRSIYLDNCEIAMDNISAIIKVSGGGLIEMYRGSITTTTGGVTALTSALFTNGGGHILMAGVDISAITGTLISNVGADAANDDGIDVKFDMCKLGSGVAFANEVFKSPNQRILATRCSNTSAAAEHQYHVTALGGDVDDDSTIRRGDDPTFEDSGTGISYKIITNSDADVTTPLWFDFPNARWAELSAGASDTLRFYIASTSALTDADIYIDVTYPDGTTKELANSISSAVQTVGGTLDLMATPATLTTDSASDWRDGGSALTGHNEYQIDIATSGDVGADSVPNVRVYITKPSVTIQIASIYDLN